MANDWKYSTLTQRERFKLIGGGDSDVYNTEKERNKMLRQQQQELGLDTKDVDLWDEAIDRVYLKATDPRRPNSNLPQFMSKRKSRPYVQLNRAIEAAQKTATQAREKATNEAAQYSIILEEFLANNGLSRDGSYAKKAFEDITNTLNNTLKSITEKYNETVNRAKEKYLG